MKKKPITTKPYYQYRGMEYRPFEESNKGHAPVKLWHEIYSLGANTFMGNFHYNPYAYAPREEFERAVDRILDRGRE